MAKKRQKKKLVRGKSKVRRVRKAADPDRIPMPPYGATARVQQDGEGIDSTIDFTAFYKLSDWGKLQKPLQLKVDEYGFYTTQCTVPVKLTERQIEILVGCHITPEDYAKNMVLRERAELKEIQHEREFKFERQRALPEHQGS